MSAENNDTTASFFEIFCRFRARLVRAVARIVQPDDIEDIVQETFLRCYKASGKQKIRHPRAFMLTTARNLALNHLARADNRLVRAVANFDESVVPLYKYAAAERESELQEQVLLLCQAIRTLPLQCRRAFILKRVYGLSRKEIASYMGITESTVQKHIAKATKMCADFLDKLESPSETQSAARVHQRRLKKQR